MRSQSCVCLAAQGADQLLSAFNVATFKNQEDDKAFWNRLIPVTEQPPDEDEIKQARPRVLALMLCRAARPLTS